MKAVDNFTEELREWLHYDPGTGLFSWAKRGKKRTVGARCGSLLSNGYTRICVNQVEFLGHRLAWWMFWGVPPEFDIDHINGVRSDNRIYNLRDVPHQMNRQNMRKATAGNRCGFLGVDLNKKSGKFRARIKLPGDIVMNLGEFSDPAVAHEAYLAAKREFHVGCTL